jgi:hypothetical protein
MPRPLRSPKKIDMHRQARRRRLHVLAVGFVVAVVGLVALSRLNGVTIQSVEIAGESVTSERELKMVVDEALDSNWFLLFPKRNSLLYPEAQLQAAILAAFPRVASVDIGTPNLQTLEVTLTEREPQALWCDEAVAAQETSCYFLDEEGVVYARAPQFSGTGYFAYHGPLARATSSTPIGGRFLEQVRFGEIRTFINALSTFADTPVSFATASDTSDYEVRLERGTILLVSSGSDLNAVLESLRSVLASEAIVEALKAGKKLESIDVRFGNRVYYKLK